MHSLADILCSFVATRSTTGDSVTKIHPVFIPVFALALSAMASSSLAQQTATATPAAQTSSAKSAAKADLLPFKATEKTLANGLKIIIVPTGFPNIVSLQIPVRQVRAMKWNRASRALPTFSST